MSPAGGANRGSPRRADAGSASGRASAALLLLFLAAGGFSFVAQAALYREYHVLYQGSELAIGLFFGSWLCWVALGASLGRLLLRRLPRVVSLVPTLSCAYALTPFLQLAALRTFRSLVGLPAFEALPLDDLLLLTALANAPVSLHTGLLFVLASASGDSSPSRNYVAESLGSFVGGAAVTALVVRGVGAIPLLLYASGLVLVAAAALAAAHRRPIQCALAIGLAVVAGAVVASGGSQRLEEAAAQARLHGLLPAAELVAHTDTPYRSVAVARLGGQTVITDGAAIAHAFPDELGPAHEAAILMTQRPHARRVLLVGDVVAGRLRHVLQYGPESVTWLDPDPAATAFLRPYLLPADQQALDDPRVTVVPGDPRASLAGLAPGFDVVAVLVDDPLTVQGNRLFTREMFALVHGRLAPGGVFVTRVRSEENALAREATTYGASVLHTLLSVFARAEVAPGQEQWFFAGDPGAPITLLAHTVARRYSDAGLLAPVFPTDELLSLWPPERQTLVRERLDAARAEHGSELLNTDRRPVAAFFALSLRARTLGSAISKALAAARAGSSWLFALPLLILLLVRLHYVAGRPAPLAARRFNALMLLGVLGGVAMALDVALLFAFQSQVGALFEQVGLVTGLFMLGLAASGLALVRLLRHAERAPRALVLAVLGVALAATLTLSPLLEWLSSASQPLVYGTFLALFVCVGALAGLAFPVADTILRGTGSGTGETAARLEAADYWGGAIAALLTGAVLIPTLGVARTATVLSVALLAVLTLLVQQWLLEGGAPGRIGRFFRKRARFRSFPTVRLSYALVAVVLSLAAVSAIVRSALDAPRVHFTATELRHMVPGTTFEERDAPFVHTVVDAAKGRPPALAVAASMAVAKDVRGYGGPLNLLVAVRADGRLERVSLLSSRETPSYIGGIATWLERLRGRPISRPFVLRGIGDAPSEDPRDVDVLTGATITSRAVVSAVNETASALGEAALGVRMQAAASRPSPLAPLLSPSVAYLLAALLLAFPVARFASSRVRLGFLAANVVLGGLVFNTQLSLFDVRRVLTLDPPALVTGSAFVLFWGALLLSVLFGPLYCGAVCPFGAAQELLSRLGLAGRVHHRLDKLARYLKFVALAVVSALLLIGADAVLGADPLRYGLGRTATGWAVVLLALIGVGSLLFYRPFCRTLCPTGALLALFNKLRLLGRLLRQRAYGACDLGVDGPRDVDCLQCDRCVHHVTFPLSPAQRGKAPFDAEAEP